MTTPAGWYQDRHRPATERYWDGDAWTDRVRVSSRNHAECAVIGAPEPGWVPPPRLARTPLLLFAVLLLAAAVLLVAAL